MLSEDAGVGTNNVAEYRAILRGLEVAERLGASHATVYSDSQLCIKQLNGEYVVKNIRLRHWYDKIRRLEKRITRVRYRWQSREEGLQPDADALAAGGEEAQTVLLKYARVAVQE